MRLTAPPDQLRGPRRHKAFTHNLLSGLLAYWKFDDGSGTTIADVTGTYNGTTNGANFWSVSSKLGAACAQLDGSTNYADLGTAIVANMNSAFTVAGWFNLSQNTGDIIGTDAGNSFKGYRTLVTGSTTVQALVGNGATSVTVTSAVVTLNAWHHCALTFNGANVTLFIDGVQAATAALAGTIGSTTDHLRIGNITNSGHAAKGLMDEFGAWSRALAGDDIRALANAGQGNPYPFVTALN